MFFKKTFLRCAVVTYGVKSLRKWMRRGSEWWNEEIRMLIQMENEVYRLEWIVKSAWVCLRRGCISQWLFNIYLGGIVKEMNQSGIGDALFWGIMDWSTHKKWISSYDTLLVDDRANKLNIFSVWVWKGLWKEETQDKWEGRVNGEMFGEMKWFK